MAQMTKPAAANGGPRDGGAPLGGNPVSGHSTPKSARRQAITLHGKPVMSVENGVGYRKAGPGELLRRPPAWSFHRSVIEQLEAAGVRQIVVEDQVTGRRYSVEWAVFIAKGFTLDRGFGPQRALALEYWRVESARHQTEPVWTQSTLFDLGERNQQR